MLLQTAQEVGIDEEDDEDGDSSELEPVQQAYRSALCRFSPYIVSRKCQVCVK